MDEIDQPVRKISWKVGTVVRPAIFAQSAGHKDFRIAIVHRQLDVRIGLVVPQQNVEARLLLFDQVVLKRQCLVLICDRDVLDIDGLPHQRACLGIGLRRLQKVGTHPRTQVFRLTYVDNLAVSIFIEITTWLGGEGSNFLVKIHAYQSKSAS